MRVSIESKEAFKTLNPLDVRAYLQNTGWRVYRELPKRGAFWRKTIHDETFEVALPYDEEVADYLERLRDLVNTVANAESVGAHESRSALQVLRDLQQSGQDIIRLRSSRPESESGSMPLDQGVDLFEGARQALLSCAWAAVSPRPFYASRPPRQVTDFMETVRLGQTEYGSYVVTLEAPVPPTFDDADVDMPDPFPRVVTKMFARSLEILREVASRGAAKDIRHAVSEGVSANLCSAIASALSSAGSYGELEVTINWAKNRMVPDQTTRVAFPSYLSSAIAEAGNLLKANSDVDDFELEGTVQKLTHTETSELSQGMGTEVVVLGWVEGRLRQVKMKIPAEARDLVIAAFQERSVIRCTGELRLLPRSVELNNARNFVEPSE